MDLVTTKGASSSSSFTHISGMSYDVFLSFRGEDTRYNFTDHLHKALVRKGIKTFIDDELQRGEEISQSLVEAIERSMISIIIFSENYASSKWCLKELVKILDCQKSNKQTVWPVFYKVDPSDVRHHRGTFGEALAEHKVSLQDDLEQVLEWEKALTEAAKLSGWLLDGHESKLIEKIVETISIHVLKCANFHVADHPIGIDPHVQDVEKLLSIGEDDVRMVGIWGIGGIGKTTVAKAVYNATANKFDACCFLDNVKDEPLLKLQNILLSKILGEEWKVENVDQGINLIKRRLEQRKVLLILDDVDKLDQLRKLAGGTDWFGGGSRVIITTRDKHFLTTHQVSEIYQVNQLSHDQAFELFSLNAFPGSRLPDDYVELASAVIGYAQGLPLALVVLGSALCGGSIEEWTDALDCYRKFQHGDIQNVLRRSFDSLEVQVKEAFLHIACFFRGESKDRVIEVLKGCDLNPTYAIKVLKGKALISINEGNRIWMHDLLEQMGKEIVRNESPTEPGKRSRLWTNDDVYHVLTESTGTETIKAIKVHWFENICLSASCFSKMKNLQIFITNETCFSGDVEYLPNELRFLDWPRCPLRSFPSNFNPKKLIELNLSYSTLSQLGEGFKNLKSLKYINLECCEFLTKIEDFSGFTNLEVLNLSSCTRLVEVHPSVGFLESLVYLNLMGCQNLTMFLRTVNLKSLRTMHLAGCTSLEIFPEIVGKMESLTELYLAGTAIKELPSSIEYLTGLEILYIYSCENLASLPCSIYKLQHLQEVHVWRCPKLVRFPSKVNYSKFSSSVESLSLHPTNSRISFYNAVSRALPKLQQFDGHECSLSTHFLGNLDCMFTLRKVDLSKNDFVSLPINIRKFINLQELDLSDCKRLLEIPELPPGIKTVDASGCVSLERFSLLSNILEHKDSQMIADIDLFNCQRLCNNLADPMGEMESNFLDGVAPFSCLFLSSHQCEFSLMYPGSTVPKWFNHRVCGKDLYGGSHHFEHVPGNAKGLALCAVAEITAKNYGNYSLCVEIRINNISMKKNTRHHFGSPKIKLNHVWLYYIPFLPIVPQLHLIGLPSTCEISFKPFLDRCMSFKYFGFHLAMADE